MPISTSYPSLSQNSTPKYAATQKVGVLIGDGFNGKEVANAIDALQRNGVFLDIVSDKLGTVTGADGITLKANKTFITTSPYLFDTLYVVGGRSNNTQFDAYMNKFVRDAYEHFKPIGVATTGQDYIRGTDRNNLSGVIFAANNPNFNQEFIQAITQMRFWDRV